MTSRPPHHPPAASVTTSPRFRLPCLAVAVLAVGWSLAGPPAFAAPGATAPVPPPPATAGPATLAGHWEGEIKGVALTVRIDLIFDGTSWKGTIDIPQQGAQGLPLDSITVSGSQVRFSIRGVPGNPTFDGAFSAAASTGASLADPHPAAQVPPPGGQTAPGSGSEIRGTFSQGAATFPFRLGREPVKPTVRPQDPSPPFPYVEREVSYSHDGIRLAGTLTLPPGAGPSPAVLLITGSGAQNRNEEILGHRPFLVIADHLTRAGIAVLRVDDRGVGGSTGSVPDSTSADFADDVLTGIRFLRAQPEIDPHRIGLLGHSEGGIIAPLVASRTREVAFLVLLAGTGLPGDAVLLRQMELVSRAGGQTEDRIQKELEQQRRILLLMRTERDDGALRGQLRAAVRAQLALATPERRQALGANEEAAVDGIVAPLLSRWFRFFLTYDPRPALRQVHVPVLALDGALDTQVDPHQNLPEIEQALHAAGNHDVTIRELPGLNHLFQHAKTGSPGEYAEIEETLAPEVLDLITRWILERFSLRTPASPTSTPQP